MADDTGLGYEGAALVFGGALALVAAAYFRTKISHVFLFWAAFILPRPLDATIRDFLDKPLTLGGLAVKPSYCIDGHCCRHHRLPAADPSAGRSSHRRASSASVNEDDPKPNRGH
jgi:hypothetical protein